MPGADSGSDGNVMVQAVAAGRKGRESVEFGLVLPTALRTAARCYEGSPAGRAKGDTGRAVMRRGLVLFYCTALVQVATVVIISVVITTTARRRLIMVVNQ